MAIHTPWICFHKHHLISFGSVLLHDEATFMSPTFGSMRQRRKHAGKKKRLILDMLSVAWGNS